MRVRRDRDVTPGTGMANDALCNAMTTTARIVDRGLPASTAPTGSDVTGQRRGASVPHHSTRDHLRLGTPAAPRPVCVAAGAVCGLSSTYPGDVTMRTASRLGLRVDRWTRVRNSTTVMRQGIGRLFGNTITTAPRSATSGRSCSHRHHQRRDGSPRHVVGLTLNTRLRPRTATAQPHQRGKGDDQRSVVLLARGRSSRSACAHRFAPTISSTACR